MRARMSAALPTAAKRPPRIATASAGWARGCMVWRTPPVRTSSAGSVVSVFMGDEGEGEAEGVQEGVTQASRTSERAKVKARGRGDGCMVFGTLLHAGTSLK